jgi:hypothetical protein
MGFRTEASLGELLSDPLVLMVMDSDRISVGEVKAICEGAAKRMQAQMAAGLAVSQMSMQSFDAGQHVSNGTRSWVSHSVCQAPQRSG